MKRRNITIISVFVAILLFFLLTFIENKIINSEPKAVVIMANSDIKRDEKLTKNMFSEVYVPITVSLSGNNITSLNEIEGNFARENINKGQIIFFQDIGTKEELKILEGPDNYEKIAVKIKAADNGVSYQIKPKDRIHLYFSGRYGAIKESIEEFNLINVNKSDNSIYTTCLLRDTEIIGVYDEKGRSSENQNFSGLDTIVIATDSNMARLINNLRSQGSFDLTK